eukprot:Gb_26020 [translate_table: standard]
MDSLRRGDLLFYFLLLPTGAVVKLLAANKYPDKAGCLRNVYNSVDKIQRRYMSGDKSELLHPKSPVRLRIAMFSLNYGYVKETVAFIITDDLSHLRHHQYYHAQ